MGRGRRIWQNHRYFGPNTDTHRVERMNSLWVIRLESAAAPRLAQGEREV